MPLVKFSDMARLGTLAKLYLWEVLFTLPSGVAGATAEQLQFRARRVQIPTRDFTPLIDPYQGLEITDTGAPTYSHECVITFTETEDGWIGKAIESWLDLSYNPATGVAEQKPNRTSNLIINLLNSTGVKYRTYTLVNAQPRSNGTGLELDYETKDGKVTYTVPFLYDYYEMS